jgi:hypothetical protein
VRAATTTTGGRASTTSGAAIVPPFRLAGDTDAPGGSTVRWRLTSETGTTAEVVVPIGEGALDEVDTAVVPAGRGGLSIIVEDAETGAVTWQRTHPVDVEGGARAAG